MLKPCWLLLLSVAAAGASADIPEQRRRELSNFLQQDCGSCHGLLFKGGLGPPLLPESLRARPDSILIDTIMNGRPGTAMPPWREFLTEQEAAWLVDRLRNPPEPP